MKHRGTSSRAGFSLLEIAVAMCLMAVIGGAVMLAADSTKSAVTTAATQAQLDTLSSSVLDRIATELSRANRDDVLPASPAAEAPFHVSQIDFQRTEWIAGAVSLGSTTRIAFEYAADEPDDGVDNDEDGLVDEGQVVLVEDLGLAGERREVLCRWVAETLEGEIPGNGLDDNGNGLRDEGGLSFDFAGDSVTIRLTVQQLSAEGALLTRTVRKTVAFR